MTLPEYAISSSNIFFKDGNAYILRHVIYGDFVGIFYAPERNIAEIFPMKALEICLVDVEQYRRVTATRVKPLCRKKTFNFIFSSEPNRRARKRWPCQINTNLGIMINVNTVGARIKKCFIEHEISVPPHFIINEDFRHGEVGIKFKLRCGRVVGYKFDLRSRRFFHHRYNTALSSVYMIKRKRKEIEEEEEEKRKIEEMEREERNRVEREYLKLAEINKLTIEEVARDPNVIMPYKKLAIAMIERALSDLLTKTHKHDASRWIMNDRSDVMSFIWCCEFAGYDHEYIRRKIRDKY